MGGGGVQGEWSVWEEGCKESEMWRREGYTENEMWGGRGTGEIEWLVGGYRENRLVEGGVTGRTEWGGERDTGRIGCEVVGL